MTEDNANIPDVNKSQAKVVDIKIQGQRCPVCGNPAVLRYKPFCSKHCADVDLSRWFNGVYSVPSESVASEADNEADSFVAQTAEGALQKKP